MEELRSKIKKVLREHFISNDSLVEQQYVDKITKVLLESTDYERRKWVTYNQVILEVRDSIKDMLKVQELQYKLTESHNPKNDCINLIYNYKDFTPEMKRLYDKISLF